MCENVHGFVAVVTEEYFSVIDKIKSLLYPYFAGMVAVPISKDVNFARKSAECHYKT